MTLEQTAALLTSFAPALTSLDALEQSAHQNWRVVAHNREFTGETEGFGFTNGTAVVTALPSRVTCSRSIAACEAGGLIDGCTLHKRMRHLAGLANYVAYENVPDQRTGRSRLVQINGYRVLSEAEYDEQYGDAPDGMTGGFEIPDI